MVITKDMLEEKIDKTTVGRGRETELFKKQFDRVLEGGMGLTVVSGAPGIGKSFFVEHAAGMLTGGGATYVHGKFRQYDSSPLVAFSEIIEQMVRHILTLPAEALNSIKASVNQKLGADVRLLPSVCPYAQILFEVHKPVRTDNLGQLKYKVRKAVYQFLTAASTALFPLILFIDDLQWADALSVGIIETLCQDYECLNLHLVLAWREDDSGKTYLSRAKLPEEDGIRIRLGGLTPSDIDEYIRLVFAQAIEHKEHLIRMLYSLTLGNPFNLSRVFRLFLEEDVVAYSDAGAKWMVRHDKIGKLSLPADIEQLLTRQITALAEEDRALLNLISCCGEAAFELLQALTGENEDALNSRLDGLCKNALLVKTVSDDGVSYGFPHDIVLRLVYNSLASDERAKIHFLIAEALKEQKSSPLMIAPHLLKSETSLLLRDGAGKWLHVLYDAGIQAKHSALVEQAAELFERCAALLSEGGADMGIRLSFDVRLELAECRYICGQAEEAKQGFEALLKKYPETQSQIEIKRKYIHLCTCDGDFEIALELGFQLLAHLNFKLDPNCLLPDLIKSKFLFSAGRIGRLQDAPVITDRKLLTILETLTAMAPAADRINDRMLAAISLKLSILSLKHGDSDYAPVAYAACCYLLFHILKDPKKGRQLEKVALALIEKCENAASKAAALCILGALTHHWSHPLGDTVACLERSAAEGEKEGASLYGSYAVTFAIITKYMTGSPLGELGQYIDRSRKNRQDRPEHYLTGRFYALYEDHIRRLAEGAPGEGEAAFEEYRNKGLFADTFRLNEDMIRLQRLYLEGKTEEAYRLAEEIAPKVSLHEGFVLNVEFLFYGVLTRLDKHRALSGAERRRNKRVIEKHLKALQYWVRFYQDNHRARYLLARAEYGALFAPEKFSDRPYREAMDFAEKQGNLSLEALANLLCAKKHRDDRRLSAFYASEAVRLYQAWGADHIGELIALDFGLAHAASASPTEPGPRAGFGGARDEGRDILFHLSRMEELREDEGYLYLLELLTGRDGVDYCAVFFEKSDEMVLKYEKRRGSDARVRQEPVSMNHLGGLPHKVIRYAARTETEVLLGGRASYGIFANDPCLKDRELSIACLPVRYSGLLIGLIYLEKAGESGFGGDLISFVKGLLPTLLSKKTGVGEAGKQGMPRLQNANSLFTERELEVLKLVADGMSNAEISGELHITLGTVRNHLSGIYGKLEVDNRVRAVMKAKELRIIQI